MTGQPNGYGVPSSLKKGSTPAERRVLVVLATPGTTVPMAAPTTSDPGRPGYHCSGKRWLHLFGKLTGTAPAVTVDVYVWDSASVDWYKSPFSATLTPADPTADFEIRGKERVAFVASARNDPDNGLELWASVNDVPADQ